MPPHLKWLANDSSFSAPSQTGSTQSHHFALQVGSLARVGLPRLGYARPQPEAVA